MAKDAIYSDAGGIAEAISGGLQALSPALGNIGAGKRATAQGNAATQQTLAQAKVEAQKTKMYIAISVVASVLVIAIIVTIVLLKKK